MSSKGDPIGEYAGLCAEAAALEFRHFASYFAGRLGSPIEARLAYAIYYAWKYTYAMETPFSPQPYTWKRKELSDRRSAFYLQATVGTYRVDFLYDDRTAPGACLRRTIVIECDGHEFHERTKTQAAHDRSRDRWMTENGIIVLRFTGSEIWRDAAGCAEQVFNVIEFGGY